MFGEKSQSESGSTYHYNKEHEDSSLLDNMSYEQDSDRLSNWDTEYDSERGGRRVQEQGSVFMEVTTMVCLFVISRHTRSLQHMK